MENIQILSDESCNFKFYEKIGCKKVYENFIVGGEPNKCGDNSFEKGFIYEKLLKEI